MTGIDDGWSMGGKRRRPIADRRSLTDRECEMIVAIDTRDARIAELEGLVNMAKLDGGCSGWCPWCGHGASWHDPHAADCGAAKLMDWPRSGT